MLNTIHDKSSLKSRPTCYPFGHRKRSPPRFFFEMEIHRENDGTLGMVPLIINPIYTLYSGYSLGIFPFNGLQPGGLKSSRVPSFSPWELLVPRKVATKKPTSPKVPKDQDPLGPVGWPLTAGLVEAKNDHLKSSQSLHSLKLTCHVAPSQKETIVFQSSIFRCYVSFRKPVVRRCWEFRNT